MKKLKNDREASKDEVNRELMKKEDTFVIDWV